MTALTSRIEFVGLTDSGRKRPYNEDSFGMDAASGLLLVADGMGGHDAGEVASKMAVDNISEFLSRFNGGDGSRSATAATAIGSAVSAACRKINDENKKNDCRDGTGMGTTIVGLWLLEDEKKAAVFHVGDSRVYRLRDHKLTQLTRDHTAYEQWMDEGGWGDPPKRNVIARALGPWPDAKADTRIEELLGGDVYLLCSDGLCNMVGDRYIELILCSQPDLRSAASDLVTMANENGGKDNITVILARYA
ncbi:MAG: hypothetical protein A3G18_08925 [Rhodospirillales bacterium RIFCSPLOWO2_12_FULL_58_28]|nr:MAG: hypothetical protein A3G18_08925 [Rhodospirillales bacterium RIFCSPLOWO2_12_FULL_58_28]